MSALAQPTRLEIVSLLARAGPEGLGAGALAERVGVAPNNMSVHMAVLSRAGLVSSVKAGRNIIYSAVPGAFGALARFLVDDCCPGALDADTSFAQPVKSR